MSHWQEHFGRNTPGWTSPSTQEAPAKTATCAHEVCISQFLPPCGFFPPLKTTPKHMSVPYLAEGYVVGRGVNTPLGVHSGLATGNILHSCTSTETCLDESRNIQALSVPPAWDHSPQLLRQNKTLSDVSATSRARSAKTIICSQQQPCDWFLASNHTEDRLIWLKFGSNKQTAAWA